MFSTDPTLASDSELIGHLVLSDLRLSNDANYLWLILVPRVEGCTELIDLSAEDQSLLVDEINIVSRLLQQPFAADKINIATLGNVVSQLHIHCIARYRDDACWPKPVWGQVPALAYEQDQLDTTIDRIVTALKHEPCVFERRRS